jgi:hypothetical protein
MATFVLLPQVQLALSLVLQLFLPAQHSSLEVQSPAILCGFKLLILLVDSFVDIVNVITSNSTVLKQRKNDIDASFITVVIYKKAVLALTGFKTCFLFS